MRRLHHSGQVLAEDQRPVALLHPDIAEVTAALFGDRSMSCRLAFEFLVVQHDETAVGAHAQIELHRGARRKALRHHFG